MFEVTPSAFLNNLLVLIFRKSSSVIAKCMPSHSFVMVWELLWWGLPVMYLNVFWLCLNVMSTSKKCTSFNNVISMHFIYKEKNIFGKHKYAFMQICTNMITHKYILPKWNRMSHFLIPDFPDGFWWWYMSYSFTNLKKTVCP